MDNDLTEPLLTAEEAGRAAPQQAKAKKWPIARTLTAAVIAHLCVAAWQLGFQWPPHVRACTHQWHDCRGLACATVALSILISWLLAELYNPLSLRYLAKRLAGPQPVARQRLAHPHGACRHVLKDERPFQVERRGEQARGDVSSGGHVAVRVRRLGSRP
mgnify:CR=1 FL=1